MSGDFISVVEGSLSRTAVPNECARWMALSRVKGLGCVSFKKIACHFDDPTKALSASAAELAAIPGLDQNVIDGLRNFSEWGPIDAEMRRAAEAGVAVVPFLSAGYPVRLRMIADPPPFLYIKGEYRAADERAVAVVGSRSASEYGLGVARELSQGLVAFGFTVVSGMARGIDGAAHESALSAGGRTIAVLGCGTDYVYPPEHAHLHRRISEQGAVVSELPLGTRPEAFNFPARNRLISGLSLGVVVVEATEKSGSLITASLALDQGREVFAVPGEARASRSRGTHRLIRQGAKLVERVEDIIEEIAPQLASQGDSVARKPERALPEGVSEEARKIFALLRERSLHIDEIIEGGRLAPAKASEVLLELELQGYVRQLPGKRYSADR